MERKTWGLPEGRNRKQEGNLPHLPFHSEMQRLLEQEPWQLVYAGNDYLACIQCALVYYASGVRDFYGTHGKKCHQSSLER